MKTTIKRFLKIMLLILGSSSAIVFFLSAIVLLLSNIFYDLFFAMFDFLNCIGITDAVQIIISIISFILMLGCFTLYAKITIKHDEY